MQNIMKSIVVLNGVYHACIYIDGEILASTFPEDSRIDLATSGQMADQMFTALEAVGKSHNEAYFATDEQYFAAYNIKDCCIILLLTEKKINFPLVHMGVQSAAAKIKSMLMREEALRQQQLNPEPVESNPEVAITAENVPTGVRTEEITEPAPPTKQKVEEKATPAAITPEVRTYMEKLLDLLVDDLGPAASFVFEDCVMAWQAEYETSKDNLIHLAKLLTDELDTKAEKKAFLKSAGRILKN